MMAIWNRILQIWQSETLTLHLKSGDKITIDRVIAWSFENKGNDVVAARIEQWRPRKRLLIKTLDLGQISAIVVGR